MSSKKQTLTQAKIATTLAHNLDIPFKEANQIVQSTLNLMSESIIQDQQLKLINFGKFIVRNKKERPGYNFHTNKQIPVKARRIVFFKPAEAFKNNVALGKYAKKF